jgi:hypothetical protein
MVRIDADRIVDWASFHEVFAEAFGFPSFYGKNMNAWIDCLSYLDDPGAGMTSIHAEKGCVLPVVVEHASEFKTRCPEQFSALVECTGFVNWRVMEQGGNFNGAPLLALAFSA